MSDKNVFLTAEWRKLALANYAVDKEILLNYLPPFTELDEWNGKCYVSLVGFMFLNTKLMGVKVPFHSSFEEVNLRFYVKYFDHGEWKRGAVFIKEIVPKPAITLVANTIYKEKYQTCKMRHHWALAEDQFEISYSWKQGSWHSFSLISSSKPEEMVVYSDEEFITEHYWGYTRINSSRTSEYGVEHPRWQVYPVKSYKIDVDFEKNYGKEFAFLNDRLPDSVMLAEGSPIRVLKGRKF